MMSEFDTAHREVMKALEGFNTGLASEAMKPLAGLDAHHEAMKALEGFNTGLASEAMKPLAGLDTAHEVMKALEGFNTGLASEAMKPLAGLDTAHREVMKALEGFNTGLASEATKPLAGLDTARREAMKALEGFNTGLASEAMKALPRLDTAHHEVMKALEGFNPGLASEAMKSLAGLDTHREVMKALAGLDTHHEVMKALEGFNTGLAREATKPLEGFNTGLVSDALKALPRFDTGLVSEALKALPRLDAALFGEAWDERLAAAVGRLDRAEDIITAASEPERAVEALATDMDTVREAAPPEAREGVNKWVQWFWIYLAQKLVLDPALDPALEQAMEAAREMALRLVVVLMVITTEPTLPTPPPSPTLQQPAALAPVSAPPEALILPGGWSVEGLPAMVLRAGPQAAERTVEFFTAQIRNPHTRAAYGTAVTRFFTWCDARGLELAQLSPVAVATYIEEMQSVYRAPTIKQHLAAIRRLFDFLVIGQVVPANPAASVRGPTHVVKTGKTPVLQPAEARLLLDSIDTSTLIGLRDRALLGVMVYSFARVSAVVNMRVEDYYQQGRRWWLRLQEKGGKHHAVPVHHKAEAYLDAYLAAAGIAAEKDSRLWRSMPLAGGLGARRLSRVDVFRMIKRRVKAVGLGEANCHTFRATGITAYLLNGGTLERAQAIAAHESPRTTKLYDRTADEVTVEDIEKIWI